MPLGNVTMVWLIRKEAAGLEEGDEVTLALKKDESEYGIPMPRAYRQC